MTSSLPIHKIKVDGGTQSRAGLNKDVVEDYAATIRDGVDFPPLTVFHDGKKYWLADGFHRIDAYKAAGAIEVPVAVHQGTRRDAILFSVGANAAHGLRRTNDDKRRAVTTLLNDKEWSAWSDRQIAKQCGVHHDMVGRLRDELSGGNRQIERTVKRGGTTFTMDTTNIGNQVPAATPSPPLPDQQADFDRQRQEVAEALPDAIKAIVTAKAERQNAAPPAAGSDLAAIIAERDELREANVALEGINDALNAKVEQYEGMRVQFEQGGFEKVIEGKDEEIRILKTQVETESRDKVRWKKSADRWKAEALKLGWSDPDVIPLKGKANG